VSFDWFTFGINDLGALTSGGGMATEGNLAMNAVDIPMDSEQSMLPVIRDGGNLPTLTDLSGWFFEVSFNFYTVVVLAEFVATFVAAAGLPPGTKLYALIPQNKQP
jgi:hypothetical protein